VSLALEFTACRLVADAHAWPSCRLQQQLQRAGVSQRQAEGDRQFHTLLENARREELANDKECEQTRGRVLRYGMVVQLQHAASQAYMYVSGTAALTSSLAGATVACSKHAADASWFRVMPKLQQVHVEGERVHVGDQIVLEHAESGMNLTMGKLTDGRAMYEVWTWARAVCIRDTAATSTMPACAGYRRGS
jgi:hypothetical protein